MHIVHIATEIAPVVKVGGLGDIVLGLGRALAAQGHQVDIVLPKYDCLEMAQISDLVIALNDLIVHYDGQRYVVSVWKGWVEGLKVYFIESPAPLSFFNRGTVYGLDDDIQRFLYFSRAAIEFLLQKKICPDIIHIHDWPTACVAPLLETGYRDLGLNPRVIYTIHNLEYQGRCPPKTLSVIGLSGKHYLTYDRMQDNFDPNSLNLMKGGILYADRVNTVSPTYAKEILNPPKGCGLESTIRQVQNKFSGILNGLDYIYWNPEHDRYLKHYTIPREPVSLRDGNSKVTKKHFSKVALRERLGLADSRKPIVCCVSRLIPQKGPELIIEALYCTKEKNGQFILLGSSSSPEITEQFEALKTQFANDPDIHINLRSSEELAHLFFAGSDMTVIPSHFEPCGLTQLIALRYGTIPIVRRTGGLADTIVDVDTSGLPLEQTNGYTFDHATQAGLRWGLERAIACWFDQPDRWNQLVNHAMDMDFSWAHSAPLYVDMYKSALSTPSVKPPV